MAGPPRPERSRHSRRRVAAPHDEGTGAKSAGLDDAGFALTPVAEEKPHYLGHRQRLRERLLNGGAAALPDYELLEFLLMAALPPRAVQPRAKKPIDP